MNYHAPISDIRIKQWVLKPLQKMRYPGNDSMAVPMLYENTLVCPSEADCARCSAFRLRPPAGGLRRTSALNPCPFTLRSPACGTKEGLSLATVFLTTSRLPLSIFYQKCYLCTILYKPFTILIILLEYSNRVL